MKKHLKSSFDELASFEGREEDKTAVRQAMLQYEAKANFSWVGNESHSHAVVTSSESNKPLNDQESLNEGMEQKSHTTAQTLTTDSAETNLPSTKTCYLVTKPCNPGTIRHSAERSTSITPNIKSCLTETDLPNYIKCQSAILKLMANNSEGKLVFICCLAMKPTPESPKKSFSPQHQTIDNQTDDHRGKLSTIEQATTNVVNKYATTDNYCQKWVETIKMHCPVADQTDAPLSLTTSDRHHLKNGQMDSLPSTTKQIDTSTSDISRHLVADDVDVPPCSPVSTTTHHHAENGQINTPSTPKQIPHDGQGTTVQKSEYSPVKNCYVDEWDLFHHIDNHEKTSVLPHDLQYLKENELLSMAYGDFTKCLKEDFCYSPTAMLMSADDDSVVPSSPSLLLGDSGKCYSTCSDTNTDGSQEYSREAFSMQHDKSASVGHEHPRSGTLNWGLAPTIIYKTPEPETETLQGDDYMKCSISAGNIELLTPPPANYKKLLRRSRRRLQRRNVRRRRIYFGDDECCQGLQEVPIKESELDGDETLDTDFALDDPMWFDDECVNTLVDEHGEKSLSVSEEDIANCYEYIRNVSPRIETTSTTLSEAMEYIKDREEGLDDSENVMIKEEEPKRSDELTNFEAILESLPKFSWNEIEEPSHEIQAILDGACGPDEVSVAQSEELCDEERNECEQTQRKKRKYQKRRFTTRKQKIPKKPKKLLTTNLNDEQNLNGPNQYSSHHNNSNSQRSDCDSVVCSGDIARPSSLTQNSHVGSRPVTPIAPKLTSGMLVNPSVGEYMPLEAIETPVILPRPPDIIEGCFSPPPCLIRSPLTSPAQLVPDPWPVAGPVIHVPARKYRGRKRKWINYEAPP